MNTLITGVSRGIGLELTRQFLQTGHTVFALARAPEKSTALKALAAENPDRLKILKADVCMDQDLKAAQKELSGVTIDCLINNAGVMKDRSENFASLTRQELEETFAVNTIAPIRVTQTFLKNLKAAKNPKLINITSLMGSIADNSSGGYYSYRMSKTALNMFAKCFTIEEPSITTLVVHPGWVKTDMGGAQAPLEAQDSAAGIIQLMEKASHEQSGRFYNYNGKELPW